LHDRYIHTMISRSDLSHDHSWEYLRISKKKIQLSCCVEQLVRGRVQLVTWRVQMDTGRVQIDIWARTNSVGLFYRYKLNKYLLHTISSMKMWRCESIPRNMDKEKKTGVFTYKIRPKTYLITPKTRNLVLDTGTLWLVDSGPHSPHTGIRQFHRGTENKGTD
jgi:hypothetical protein